MSDISNQLATLSNNIDNQVSGALYQAYCLGRSKGRANAEKEHSEMCKTCIHKTSAEDIREIRAYAREEAIEECMRAIVNTESKVFNPCADKEWDVLTLLADRQFEILNILEQLKENGNE